MIDRLVILSWLLSSVGVVGAKAQTTPTVPEQVALAPQPYVDGSFGFAIHPPVGFHILREKRMVEKADYEIVRFYQLELTWSLSVRFTQTTRPLDKAMIVSEIKDKLKSEVTDLRILDQQETKIDEHYAIRLAASFAAEGNTWLRQQAVIRRDARDYFNIILITPLADQKSAANLFDKMIASFDILRTQAMQERITQALKQGKELLNRVQAGQIDLSQHTKQDDRFLRITQNGQDQGFVHIHEEPTTVEKHKGVTFHEWGWLFTDEDTFTHMQNHMFLANDLSFEKWDNEVLSVATSTPHGDQPQTSLMLESAIREKNMLLIQYTAQPNADELKDKALEVEDTYASAAWWTLLPRIIDLKQPSTLGFSTYNSDRRGLVLRVMDVVGPERINLDGLSLSATTIEDSEGLIPPINQTYVESTGRILKIVAKPIEMIRTDKTYIDRHFGSKVKKAQKVLENLRIKYPKPASRLPEKNVVVPPPRPD